ncbi:MAG TPA: CoA transferase [Dehalococcoidia bacterium]|nr:CoA transferase [Dehalococcoidia bacterium]
MDKRLPFEGVKVVEWTQAINGPWTGAWFSDFGAEVIKIESTKFPEMGRVSSPYKDNIPGPNRSVTFNTFNTGKKSFTVDLKHPRGRELFMGLVQWADIVLQNQRPGLMKKMGFGYEELRKVKEDIIVMDISIMGQEGPLVGVGGWGSNSMAQSGQFYYYRFPDSGPLSPGFTAVPDAIGPMYAAMAGIAALDYKRQTGKGQYLDISQLEPMVHFLGPAVLNYTMNNRIQPPIGSRDPDAAPHNAFRCRGDDRWCVIAVFTDQEWQAFCRVLGNPEWTQSAKFATLSSRKENESELEERISQWTMQYTPREVMTMMQEAGVPAGVVQNVEDIVDFDPQVKARELLLTLHHEVVGDYLHTRWPFIMSNTPPDIKTGPLMGEHNHYICTEILGMSDEEFVELINEEVVA